MLIRDLEHVCSAKDEYYPFQIIQEVTNCKQFNMQIHCTSTMLVKTAVLISKIKQMFCEHACEK